MFNVSFLRDPEPHVTLNITPDPDCAILGRGLSFTNRNMFVEKINE